METHIFWTLSSSNLTMISVSRTDVTLPSNSLAAGDPGVAEELLAPIMSPLMTDGRFSASPGTFNL